MRRKWMLRILALLLGMCLIFTACGNTAGDRKTGSGTDPGKQETASETDPGKQRMDSGTDPGKQETVSGTDSGEQGNVSETDSGASANSLTDGTAGSVSYPDGRTVVVTILASDTEYSWTDSESDQKRISNICLYLGIACDYLEQQAAKYAHRLSFIYDFEKDSSLYYKMTSTIRLSDSDDQEGDQGDGEIWNFIDTSVPSEELLEKNDAANILYLVCMNSDVNSQEVTATRSWYEDMPYPYEFVELFYIDSGEVNPPAVYAHEMLHTFGAPDLYMPYAEDGVTSAEISWVEENRPNDIMLTCSDLKTGEYVYKDITNDVTDVTAWYVNWDDQKPEGLP